MDGMQHVPQERVQNRTDIVLPQPRKKLAKKTRFAAEHWESQVRWEVVTSKTSLHRGDQACGVDTVGFNIKGLDKFNMPQSQDVMVPVPQIQEQIVDVSGQEQGIVRVIPEVLIVERIQEQIHDRHFKDVKKAFAVWDKRLGSARALDLQR